MMCITHSKQHHFTLRKKATEGPRSSSGLCPATAQAKKMLILGWGGFEDSGKVQFLDLGDECTVILIVCRSLKPGTYDLYSHVYTYKTDVNKNQSKRQARQVPTENGGRHRGALLSYFSVTLALLLVAPLANVR